MSVRFGTFDTNWQQTSEVPIDLRVCECCPTTAVITSEEPVVAFRNRTEDEVRDIYVSRLENGKWTEPKAVHNDGWKIPACPVNGPTMSARGRNVAIAWFTVKNDEGHAYAYAAFSTDAGRTFGEPIRVDETSALGRVDIELPPDGSAVATWIEFAEQRSQFSTQAVHPSGRTSARTTVAAIEGAQASGYPRVAHSGDELVFAWTESKDGTLRVRTAVTRVGTGRSTQRAGSPVINERGTQEPLLLTVKMTALSLKFWQTHRSCRAVERSVSARLEFVLPVATVSSPSGPAATSPSGHSTPRVVP